MRRLELGRDPYPWNVSADGRFLGATHYDTGNAAIIDLATGKHRVLTNYGNWNHEKGYIDQAAVSRDGKFVAFWHYKYGGTEGNLRVVGSDGKGERVLYRSPYSTKEKGIEWGIPYDWSPDGSQIVVQLARGKQGSLTAGVTDFVLVPLSGSTPRVVKTAEYLRHIQPKIRKISFSPDGKYLAYDYPQRKELAQNGIHILQLGGGQEAVVAEHPADDRFFGWIPGGDILFISERTEEPALFRVRVRNGRQAGEPELLQEGVEGEPIGVSQSGAVYYSARRTAYNAYTDEVDFSAAKLLSQPKPVSERQDSTLATAWSRDGSQLAWLVPHIGTGGNGGFNIVIRNERDGAHRELLPQGQAAGGGWLAWHPDGKSLLARGTRGDKSGLYRIDARTGEMTLLYETTNIAWWSDDGKSSDGVWVLYPGGRRPPVHCSPQYSDG